MPFVGLNTLVTQSKYFSSFFEWADGNVHKLQCVSLDCTASCDHTFRERGTRGAKMVYVSKGPNMISWLEGLTK